MCKILFHPIIDQASIKMHQSGLLQDSLLQGRPMPSLYQYLKEAKASAIERDSIQRQGLISNEQKYNQIAELMKRHSDLMDLSCYNPETVPSRFRNFLSHGNIEGAMAKSAAERGVFHAWSQTSSKHIVLNAQVEWYAENAWLKRVANTDKFLNR